MKRKPESSPSIYMVPVSDSTNESSNNIELEQEYNLKLDVEIHLIDRSPFQNKIADHHATEFTQELASNINDEKLNSPVILRDMGNGRYQMIAGHHRLDAYISNGEKTIPAIIKKCDDITAAKATILDNIFKSSESPLELWRGFKILLDMKAFSSQSQLASKVSISKTEMSRLFCFDHFTERALEAVECGHKLIGSNSVETLSKYMKDHEDIAVLAIEAVVDGKLQQNRINSWIQSQISKDKKEEIQIAPPRELRDSNGNHLLSMKVDKDKGTIAIKSKSPISVALEDKIFELIKAELNLVP